MFKTTLLFWASSIFTGCNALRRMKPKAPISPAEKSRKHAEVTRKDWLRKAYHNPFSDIPRRQEKRTFDLSFRRRAENCESIEPVSCKQPKSALAFDVVVSAYDEDVGWLAEIADIVNISVYFHQQGRRSHELDKPHHGPDPTQFYESKSKLESNERFKWPIKFSEIPNIGDEAHSFLKYITENYNTLPDNIFFVHGHRCSWHDQKDMASEIQSRVNCPSNQSYANLNMDYDGGLHAACYYLDGRSPDESGRVKHTKYMWDSLLSKYMGPTPQLYCMDCCAQFLVDRKAVRYYPREFYVELLNANLEGKSSMEYLWRAIFKRDFQSKAGNIEYTNEVHRNVHP